MSDTDTAEMYGLTLAQFNDARAAAARPLPWAMSNKLMAMFLKYPEPVWRRVIAASIDVRKMSR